MAIQHAAPGEIVNVQALGADLASHRTSALIKTDSLEIMRLILLAGKSVPSHRVAGEIIVQCVEGLVELTVDDRVQKLAPGQLLLMPGGAAYSLVAIENSSLLVTLVLRA